MIRSRRAGLVLASAAVAGAFILSACASNSESSGPTSKAGAAGSGSASSTVDQALAAKVPADIKSAGKITVGTDPTYAPNEYKDPSGKIIGFDIDLFNAVAAKLGLTVKYTAATFDNIVPGVAGGKYNMGVSSFTDNKQREKVVDFVTYYNAGTQWAAPAGKTVSPDNACGLKVAVQTGTVQDTEDLPVRQKKCKDAGKPAIQVKKFDAQSDATTAVALGQADAMLADSPVTQAAVKQSNGKLQLAGDIYDAAPYGYAIGKNEGQLKEAIQGSVQALIADGTYHQICQKWGLTAGEIKEAKINGATS